MNENLIAIGILGLTALLTWTQSVDSSLFVAVVTAFLGFLTGKRFESSKQVK